MIDRNSVIDDVIDDDLGRLIENQW